MKVLSSRLYQNVMYVLLKIGIPTTRCLERYIVALIRGGNHFPTNGGGTINLTVVLIFDSALLWLDNSIFVLLKPS